MPLNLPVRVYGIVRVVLSILVATAASSLAPEVRFLRTTPLVGPRLHVVQGQQLLPGAVYSRTLVAGVVLVERHLMLVG